MFWRESQGLLTSKEQNAQMPASRSGKGFDGDPSEFPAEIEMVRSLLLAARNFFSGVVDVACGRVAPASKGRLVGWKYHVPRKKMDYVRREVQCYIEMLESGGEEHSTEYRLSFHLFIFV